MCGMERVLRETALYYRSAWRVVTSMAEKSSSSGDKRHAIANEYLDKIVAELDAVCQEVLVSCVCTCRQSKRLLSALAVKHVCVCV